MRGTRKLFQASLRRQRTERFLYILENNQPISRIELATLTGMSPASVTRLVNVLMSLGLVREISVTDTTGRGRRPVNLQTSPEAIYALGFHVAPDSVRCCLLDFGYSVRAGSVVPIRAEDLRPARVARIAGELAGQLLPVDSSRVRVAGVSVSGQIDTKTGLIRNSKAFGWRDENLAVPLGEALGRPVRIENDTKACLTWECLRRGYLETPRDIAYLYIGKAGIGFANLVDGRLLRGAADMAGEIEDVSLSMGKRLGDLLMKESLVHRARCFAPAVQSVGDIFDAYRMEILWARMLVDDYAGNLNRLLHLVFALLDPHKVILGGDMADALRERPELIQDSRCEFGENYEDACACGAAYIAMREAVLNWTNEMAEAEQTAGTNGGH